MEINRHAGQITQELVAWVTQHLPDMRVSATSLGGDAHVAADSANATADGHASGVDIRLVGAAPRVTPITAGRKRAALALDYLLTVRLPDPLAEHRVISDLAFAALDSGDLELVTDHSVAEICRAHGLPPQSGLLLRTEARQERVLPQAPLVRFPANTSLTPLVQAEGVVTGPDNVPIPGALVTLAGSNRSMITGPDGRFHFAIPDGSPAQVTARAKSREVTGPLVSGPANAFPLPMEA